MSDGAEQKNKDKRRLPLRAAGKQSERRDRTVWGGELPLFRGPRGKSRPRFRCLSKIRPVLPNTSRTSLCYGRMLARLQTAISMHATEADFHA